MDGRAVAAGRNADGVLAGNGSDGTVRCVVATRETGNDSAETVNGVVPAGVAVGAAEYRPVPVTPDTPAVPAESPAADPASASAGDREHPDSASSTAAATATVTAPIGVRAARSFDRLLAAMSHHGTNSRRPDT